MHQVRCTGYFKHELQLAHKTNEKLKRNANKQQQQQKPSHVNDEEKAECQAHKGA